MANNLFYRKKNNMNIKVRDISCRYFVNLNLVFNCYVVVSVMYGVAFCKGSVGELNIELMARQCSRSAQSLHYNNPI